ncbi:DNA repair protein [Lampropedia cohaerens]|uniref:DNA repair protein RecN n=1 Tax=Lampropedia cohaerens TaxID=1610491 RepID=A0A0U1Q048_9BURK|nr:DNA repair protein RecN [Lampropedia cohaerens]KKW68132.1 DNA repair protein [Lampropedia cohaerens]
MALRHLALRDFVLVQSMALDLRDGFTVLSGETGAGKSILIDALQLVLGGRGDAGVVREGAARAELVAEFDPPAPDMPALRQWLQEHDFAHAEESLLLRRIIDAQGKSRCWINGSVATVGQLHALGEMLVDIHGQHAWQSLMRPHAVRNLLDGFAGVATDATERAWQQWRQAQERLTQARQNQEQVQQDRERLQWQIEEVGKLAPGAQEWLDLNSRHTLLMHQQDLQQAALQAWQWLDGDETAAGALAAVQRAASALAAQQTIEPQFTELVQALEQLADPLADVARSLRDYAQRQDVDGADLAEVDARVASWLSLARRYRTAPEELHARWQDWKARLAALDAGSDIASLEAAQEMARKQYLQAAQALSERRRAAAPKLAKIVNQALAQLGMGGERFAIEIGATASPQAHGLDDVQFTIATHAGATRRPLAKVASGGELSRISLAIAVCTSRLGGAETLVFDEVDAGIGGAVAHSVGKLLAQLGRDRQVLAVTHLPQVAIWADHQFVVEKSQAQGGLHSHVRAVSDAARVAEIARMLGSEVASDATLAHAREMLQSAQATDAVLSVPAKTGPGRRGQRGTTGKGGRHA